MSQFRDVPLPIQVLILAVGGYAAYEVLSLYVSIPFNAIAGVVIGAVFVFGVLLGAALAVEYPNHGVKAHELLMGRND
jgi:riboflavin transporter FmnP